MSYPGLPALIGSKFYGVKDKHLRFVRANGDRVDCGSDSSLNTPYCTLEAWVKVASVTPTSTAAQIINRRNTSPVTFGMVHLVSQDFAFQVRTAAAPTGASSVVATSTYNLNQWYHLAATFDGLNQRLYIDGELDNTTTLGTATTIDTSNFQGVAIGTRYSQNDFFHDGDIDEVRIWNHARTPDQIKRYMYTRLYGTETGLVAYYPMNEGTGSTAYDKSTNSNDGTITGATWIKP
jgi:hypothetical protein